MLEDFDPNVQFKKETLEEIKSFIPGLMFLVVREITTLD